MNNQTFSVACCIPTYQGEKTILQCLQSLQRQEGIEFSIFLFDSESTDKTKNIIQSLGYDFQTIKKEKFDHSGTRKEIVEKINADIIVFLTQDAILATPDSLFLLVSAFEKSDVGAAYGRQLPRYGANEIEAHARIFNYPKDSYCRSIEEKEKFGIKTAFFSDSFGAYRREVLLQAGNFPEKNIVGEDMVAAAKILKNGWKIAYVSESQVFHSHRYTIFQEFKRYFDVGAFHTEQNWIIKEFGKANGEGKRFFISEQKYLSLLAKNKKSLFLKVEALIRTVSKYIGYKIGMNSKYFPKKIKKALSMHKYYWN